MLKLFGRIRRAPTRHELCERLREIRSLRLLLNQEQARSYRLILDLWKSERTAAALAKRVAELEPEFKRTSDEASALRAAVAHIEADVVSLPLNVRRIKELKDVYTSADWTVSYLLQALPELDTQKGLVQWLKVAHDAAKDRVHCREVAEFRARVLAEGKTYTDRPRRPAAPKEGAMTLDDVMGIG